MKFDSIVKNTAILIVSISFYIWASSTKHEFQLIQLGDMARNQFLLDKGTGRVWQNVCDGEIGRLGECDGLLIWNEMFITGLTPYDSGPALIYDHILQKRENKSPE